MYHIKQSNILQIKYFKITVFWDKMSCSLVYRHQRLGGTCCLQLQDRKFCFTSRKLLRAFELQWKKTQKWQQIFMGHHNVRTQVQELNFPVTEISRFESIYLLNLSGVKCDVKVMCNGSLSDSPSGVVTLKKGKHCYRKQRSLSNKVAEGKLRKNIFTEQNPPKVHSFITKKSRHFFHHFRIRVL